MSLRTNRELVKSLSMKTFAPNLTRGWESDEGRKEDLEKVSQCFIILDAGHGGMDNGKYVSPHKQFKPKGGGAPIYEGVFNRRVREYAVKYIESFGLQYIVLNDSPDDWPLRQRTDVANAFMDTQGAEDFNFLFLSIHGNASRHADPRPRGLEVFTHGNASDKSKLFSKFLVGAAKKILPLTYGFRLDERDGYPDKTANFHVVRETRMPAALLECGFMTNDLDRDMMQSRQGQQLFGYMIAVAWVKYVEAITGVDLKSERFEINQEVPVHDEVADLVKEAYEAAEKKLEESEGGAKEELESKPESSSPQLPPSPNQ